MSLPRLLAIVLLALCCGTAAPQCPATNTAFDAGEDLHYQLYFNWKFIWMKAGTANLNISQATHNGQPAYRCHLITRGNARTDKFFMMRDTLVSYVSHDLLPLYYRKGALEGKRYYVDELWYSYPANGGVTLDQRFVSHRGEVSVKQEHTTECPYDMCSMLLRARSFDPKDYKEGQRITFPMADGHKVRQATLIYRGRETFKMDNTGDTYRCLVFSFVDIEGRKEKEVVTFYVTDDLNHMPVRLDLYLRFGTAKAFLRQATGLRNPQTALIKK